MSKDDIDIPAYTVKAFDRDGRRAPVLLVDGAEPDILVIGAGDAKAAAGALESLLEGRDVTVVAEPA